MPLPPRIRAAPVPLADVLARMARGSGESQLRGASVSAALAAALGPYLARRLARVSVDGATCRLWFSDPAAAREVERHGRDILDEVRRRIGALAPDRLDVLSERAVRAPEIPGRAPEAAAAASDERPLSRRALEDVADEATRARLARWARLA